MSPICCWLSIYTNLPTQFHSIAHSIITLSILTLKYITAPGFKSYKTKPDSKSTVKVFNLSFYSINNNIDREDVFTFVIAKHIT